MESLPIFLDKLVPPWAAILTSVTLILLFGEILPQALCTRYGMVIGASMAHLVRILLMLFFPIAYPISKVLDWILDLDIRKVMEEAMSRWFKEQGHAILEPYNCMLRNASVLEYL